MPINTKLHKLSISVNETNRNLVKSIKKLLQIKNKGKIPDMAIMSHTKSVSSSEPTIPAQGPPHPKINQLRNSEGRANPNISFSRYLKSQSDFKIQKP